MAMSGKTDKDVERNPLICDGVYNGVWNQSAWSMASKTMHVTVSVANITKHTMNASQHSSGQLAMWIQLQYLLATNWCLVNMGWSVQQSLRQYRQCFYGGVDNGVDNVSTMCLWCGVDDGACDGVYDGVNNSVYNGACDGVYDIVYDGVNAVNDCV